MKFIHYVDFPYLVNYKSGYTSFVYQAPLLLIKLEKKEIVEWKSLQQMKNKDLDPIRKASRARRGQDDEQKTEQMQKLKIHHDGFSVRE